MWRAPDGTQGGEAYALSPAELDRAERWYALHVRSQYEQKVVHGVESACLGAYLPSYSTRVRWSDRTKITERLLFPGYVFARFDIQFRRLVLPIPGVIRILGWDPDHPAALEDIEIERVRQMAGSGLELASMPLLAAGDRIRVVSGPLQGIEGSVVRLKGKLSVVVSVPMIGRSVAAQIERDQLVRLPNPPTRRHAA